MKLLRETIRRILSENHEESYPTIMDYLNGSKKDVIHALELADTLGLIRIVHNETKNAGWDQGSTQIYKCSFECLEPEFREYIRVNKLSRRERPMVWWQFPMYTNRVEIKIVAQDGV